MVPVALEGILGRIGITVRVDAMGRIAEVRTGLAGNSRDRAEEFADADLRMIVFAFELEENRQRRRRIPERLRAAEIDVLFAEILVQHPAVPVAFVLLDRFAGEAQREIVGDGHVNHAVGLEGLVVAVAGRDVAREVAEFRLGRNDVDRTGCRVAAVERRLRAFQHFDVVEIEEVEILLGERGQIDVVDIDADRGIVRGREIVEADAADGDDLLGAGDVVLDVEIGHLAHQIPGRLDTRFADFLRGDGRDVDGHIEDVFGALLRGDGDGLDGLTALVLGGGGSGRQRAQGRAGQQYDAKLMCPQNTIRHDTLPLHRLSVRFDT